MVLLEEELERTSKYIKKWAKRFVCFDDSTRKISYGTSKDKIKSSMSITKVIRAAEQTQVRSDSGNLHAVTIEGTAEDGKPDSWSIRMPDAKSFDLWYTTMRNCLAAQGMMDPLNFGLPTEDPRNGLSFVTVPLEHLNKFALLEKAILYYFGFATMHGYEHHTAPQEHIIMVGDRNLYIFRPNADVLRCVPIDSITGLKGPQDATAQGAFGVVKVQPTEHDIVIKATTDLTKILQIIADVYKGLKSTSLAIEFETSGPVDAYVEAKDIKLKPLEGYKMKAMSPTPKSKLKIALDLYQQQHGSTYSRGGKRTKAEKVAAVQAAGAAAAGGSLSQEVTAGGATDNIDDSLSRLLARLRLSQYGPVLRNQHVDVELLSCMDAADLNNFGIKDPKHCEAIVSAAADHELNGTPVDKPMTPPPGTSQNMSPAGSFASPPGSPTRKMVITLDSDDEDLMPVMNNSVSVASPLATTSTVVILDDSDDDLVVVPPTTAAAPAPKPSIVLDDDDI
eukprot:GILI01011183.1.p1 GENE.GILI01011183.1~~GILI01011183.1.p1  ORF type:complete len:506 (+),score=129.96 GILI01011183.1:210-1727(+)